MSTSRESSTRLSRRPTDPSDPSSTPPTLPVRVFAPDFLAWRDEPQTAWQADTAGPWHVERHPKASLLARSDPLAERLA